MDVDTKLKFTMSQLITVGGMLVSIVGSYYALNAKIQALEEAASKLKQNEQQYTWPAQRKLEEDVAAMRLEFTTTMKDLEYSMRDLDDLKSEIKELNK
jgi:septal ring factor EnvC (AmiA/AmiB activator)